MKKYALILVLFVLFGCSQSSKNDSQNYSNEYSYSTDDEMYKDKKEDDSYAESEGGTVNEKSMNEEYITDETKTTAPATGEVTDSDTETSETSEDIDDNDTSYLNFKLTDRKIIKTASMKFKVENVEKTTDKIEDLAREFEGYTSLSKLQSYQIDSEEIELSKDSVLNVSEYYVVNNMTIIVPKKNFDAVLKELSKLYIYLDYREISTEDVSTTFLRNKLKLIVKQTYSTLFKEAAEEKAKKLNEYLSAEQKAMDLENKAIDDKIANFTLQDRIDYSRISINLYQESSVYKSKSKNTNLSGYKPSFWLESYRAIQSGFEVLLSIFVGILQIWSYILIVFVIYFLFRYLKKKGFFSKNEDKK